MIKKADELVEISFSKSNTKYIKTGYIKLMTQAIKSIEAPGVDIKDIHFASSSESVYVSFKFTKKMERELSLTGAVYMGHFRISGHRRFAKNTATKNTFYTQQAESLSELAEVIGNKLVELMKSGYIMEDYVSVLSDKELDVLRMIDEAQVTERMRFEVNPVSFERDRLYTVTIKRNMTRNVLGTMNNAMSSCFLTSLRDKGCLYGIPSEYPNVSSIAITSTGRQVLKEYGYETSLPLWEAFTGKLSFELWEAEELGEEDYQEKTISLVYEPNTDELDDLKIDMEWYKEFEERYTLVDTGTSMSNIDTKLWITKLSEFISEWLPEEKDLIYGNLIVKNHSGAFYISVENEFTTDSTELFYMITVNPQRFVYNNADTSVYTHGLTAVEFLRNLREILANEISNTNLMLCTAEDIKAYLMLKQLERSNVALIVERETINYKRVHMEAPEEVYPVRLIRNQQGGEIISEPVSGKEMQKLLRLVSKFNSFGIWVMSLPKSSDTYVRVHTSEATDEIFRYFQSLMPYIADDIIREDNPFVPVICGMELGRVDFIKPSDMFNI